ncbi:MAG: hypothetical protein K9M99_10705 [Candidatus Cloacimonetes bacterium]|nr:hypothetical protein [Candidatus Cloacimonadota bacterium]
MIDRTKLFLIVVFLLSISLVFANGGLFGWKGVYGSQGRLTIASQSIDLSSLNDDIEFVFEVTYPESFINIGAQYLYLSNNVALGMEGYLLNNGTHADEINTYQVSANAVFFDLGYVLYSNFYTVLTPWAGIGLGNLTYSMCSQENDWIQAVDQGTPYVFSASKQSIMANFGISWEAVYRKAAIGIHASYMFPTSTTDWHIAGEVMEQGPDSSLDGLRIGISLGFTDIDMW